MTTKEIFEHYILAGKPVTLQFSSMQELRNFKATITVYKHRFNKSLGMDILDGKIITCTRVLDAVLTIVIDTAPKPILTPRFSIVL